MISLVELFNLHFCYSCSELEDAMEVDLNRREGETNDKVGQLEGIKYSTILSAKGCYACWNLWEMLSFWACSLRQNTKTFTNIRRHYTHTFTRRRFHKLSQLKFQTCKSRPDVLETVAAAASRAEEKVNHTHPTLAIIIQWPIDTFIIPDNNDLPIALLAPF